MSAAAVHVSRSACLAFGVPAPSCVAEGLGILVCVAPRGSSRANNEPTLADFFHGDLGAKSHGRRRESLKRAPFNANLMSE